MRGQAVVAIVALCGCDRVFGLEGRSDPIDGSRDTSGEACPLGYGTIAGGTSLYRYVVDTTPRNWQYAHDDCANDTETHITHLVVFDDLTEMGAVRAAVPNPEMENWHAWTGYARDTSSDPFRFFAVTGEEVPVSIGLLGSERAEQRPRPRGGRVAVVLVLR